MTRIDENKNILCSRGDSIRFSMSCKISGSDDYYEFPAGSKFIFTIARNLREKYLIQKVVTLNSDSETIWFELTGEETKSLCNETAKPQEYLYDIIYNGTKSLVCYSNTEQPKFIIYPRTYEQEGE